MSAPESAENPRLNWLGSAQFVCFGAPQARAIVAHFFWRHGWNRGFVARAILPSPKIGILAIIVNFTPFYLVGLPITFSKPSVIATYIPWIFQMRSQTICGIAIAALLLASRSGGEEIQWQTDIEQGRRLAAQTGKRVLVHFWSTSCPPCRRLESQVYSRSEVAEKISATFIPVKIDAASNASLLRHYQIRLLPTDLIMEPDGSVLSVQRCPLEATTYLAGLTRFAAKAKPAIDPARAPQRAASLSHRAGSRSPTAGVDLGPRYGETNPGPNANAAANSTPPVYAFEQSVPPNITAPAPSMVENPTVVPAAGMYGLNQAMYQPKNVSATVVPPTPPTDAARGALPNQYRPQPVRPQAPLHARTPIPPPTPSTEPVLESMCVVQLVENEQWVAGDRRWGAFHRGRLHLFSGEQQQRRFMSNPDFYSPVLSGDDPVLAYETRQLVPGKRQHGVFYNHRIYLFSSEDTLTRFYRNPTKYSEAILKAEAATAPRR